MDPDHGQLTATDPDLIERARIWRSADPDPDTQFEVEQLIASGNRAALGDRFARHLRFGTGGLRGELGAGPNRMNRVVVRHVVTALLEELDRDAVVVVGFDARPCAAGFVAEIIATTAAAGIRIITLPDPVPSPVLSFAVRHLEADAGIMITASHNAATDAGLKIYGRSGAPIVPPLDGRIEARMIEQMANPVPVAPRDQAKSAVHQDLLEDHHARQFQGDIVGAYLDAALRDVLPDRETASLEVVYTPLHGAALDTTLRACVRRGIAPAVLATQIEVDPAAWTVDRPNPEEPPALAAVLRFAAARVADVVFAHDGDGDRLGVCVPVGGGWRQLNGDEIGMLLADHRLRTTTGEDRLVASTVVSSSMLPHLAKAHGVAHRETLPGMRWVIDAASSHPDKRLVFGYEEALGYTFGGAVQDKDAVAAMMMFIELFADLRRAGRTVFDRLDDLARAHGGFHTTQVSVRHNEDCGRDRICEQMNRIRAEPPTRLGDHDVVSVLDFAIGDTKLPPSNLLRFELTDGARVLLRPSDTEAKLKAYVELRAPSAQQEAQQRLALLADSVRAMLSD